MSAHDHEQERPSGIGTEWPLMAYLSIIVAALLVACIYPYAIGKKHRLMPADSQSQAMTAERSDDSDPGSTLQGTPATQSGLPPDDTSRESEEARADNSFSPDLSDSALTDVSGAAQGGGDGANREFSLLESDFNLPGAEPRPAAVEGNSSDPIRVRKTVAMGNGTIGSIPITIDSSSRLSLEARDLRQLLSGQAGFSSRLERMPEQGTVSFERLRTLGIDLRYNPTLDQVTLQAI